MLADERRHRILEIIETNTSAAVDELSEQFDVSEMTIRRDLDVLQSEGLIRRVYGGATCNRGRGFEPPFFLRQKKESERKARIGRRASQLIEPGDSIALDVGTTTLAIARHLEEKRNLTIITPSLHIAGLLGGQPDIRLILTGGIIRPRELSLVGALAEYTFTQFNLDKLFLGIGGIDFDSGLTEFNAEDARVKRAMLRSAKKCIAVFDSTKFGRTTFAAVGDIDEVHTVVTDENLDPVAVSSLEERGIEVILA